MVASSHVPEVGTILETALYVKDLARSVDFYQRILGLTLASEPSERMCALSVTRDQVLLLFKQGGSVQPTVHAFGTIPPTDGSGSLHVAFAIRTSDFEVWESRLPECGVAIESVVVWPEGGRSIYFRDPDSHVVELKTSNWQGQPVTFGGRITASSPVEN
jgi:catechol 2,3-dioxygenase-like lactoylglutathione lyase family enzyme